MLEQKSYIHIWRRYTRSFCDMHMHFAYSCLLAYYINITLKIKKHKQKCPQAVIFDSKQQLHPLCISLFLRVRIVLQQVSAQVIIA